MPIMMVADIDGQLPYPLFKGVCADIRYRDFKEPFGHESYRSAHLMRLWGNGFPVPDAQMLRQQNDMFVALFGELFDLLAGMAGLPVRIPEPDAKDHFLRFPVPAQPLPAGDEQH